MDFQTLQTEFFAMGYDDWNDASAGLARSKRLLNEAYKGICAKAMWPFVETSASGTAPLTIADVRHVQSVADSTSDTTLHFIARDILQRQYPDLPDTGAPVWWYWKTATQIGVYPANTTDTITVQYAKVPADLVSNGDTPIIPAAYHFLIVKLAAMRANLYKNNAGAEAAAFLRSEADRELADMADELLVSQVEPESIERVW